MNGWTRVRAGRWGEMMGIISRCGKHGTAKWGSRIRAKLNRKCTVNG